MDIGIVHITPDDREHVWDHVIAAIPDGPS